ncbi:hypothetical protein D8Y20_00225 [Mariprofundus sp. EBB-1]|nr:hypothetical protein D8Y20_00225 [Mariprofundus sp. EBB-1]
MSRFFMSICIIMLSLVSGLAQAERVQCRNFNEGWVHWDNTNNQNIICVLNQIKVYRELHKQGDGWVYVGDRYMCKEPTIKKDTVRYTFDHSETSRIPFYSYAAIDCLERKYDYLLRSMPRQ